MKTCIHCGYSAPGEWAECPACGQPVPAGGAGSSPSGGSPYPSDAPPGGGSADPAYAQTVLNMPAGGGVPGAPGGPTPSPGGLTPSPGGPTPPPGGPAAGGPAPGGYPAYGGGPSPANPYASPSSDVSGPVPYYNPAYEAMLPTSGKAIASLVLGILSIALIYFGIILGPLAIGLWASARKDLEAVPPRFKGKGMNTAGLVTGIIGTIIGVLIVAGIAFAVCVAERAASTSY